MTVAELKQILEETPEDLDVRDIVNNTVADVFVDLRQNRAIVVWERED